MEILTTIGALISAAAMYLQLSVGTPNQQNAVMQAQQAISTAQTALAQYVAQQGQIGTAASTTAPVATSTPTQSPSSTPIMENTPPQGQPAPAQTPAAAPAPVSQARIEIISPIPSKGAGRTFKANTSTEELADGSNFVVLGAIVYGDDGQPVGDATVTVTATDDSQNKQIDGTGNVVVSWINGVKTTVPYYSFPYRFTSAGMHTITFVSGSLETSMNLNAN